MNSATRPLQTFWCRSRLPGGMLLGGCLLMAGMAGAAETQPVASALAAAKKADSEMDRAVLAAVFLEARKETLRLLEQVRDLRTGIAAGIADAGTRDKSADEARQLLQESIERKVRADLAPAGGDGAARDLASSAADRQAKAERIRAFNDQLLDQLRQRLAQQAGRLREGLAGPLYAQVDARWLTEARNLVAELETHLRLAGADSPAWAVRNGLGERLEARLNDGEKDLQEGATEAAKHIHPVKQHLDAALASLKEHVESANLLEDLPGGNSRYSVLVGWRHSQFEDGSGNRSIAGVMVYHHFAHELAPQITVAALFTGAEFKDKSVAGTGLTGGATAVESLQTSQSFMFGGSLYWPLSLFKEPMDLNQDGLPDATWTCGPVLKAGAYVRASETERGNSTQANGAGGVRFSLGTNAFLDLCYGRNQELYADRLVLGVQMPILLLGSQKPGNRLYFSGEGNIGLKRLPTYGEPGQLQSDDVFRFSLVLEIPVQSLARKFSVPYLAE